MRPGDGSGGAGGVPAARMGEMESAVWMEEEPDLVLHGFAGEAATTRRHDGGGSFGAPATRTPAIDCGDHISFTGLGDYADVSVHGREMMYDGNQLMAATWIGQFLMLNMAKMKALLMMKPTPTIMMIFWFVAKSNRQLPKDMDADAGPASPPAATPLPAPPRQAPFGPPRHAAAPPRQPPAPPRQAAAVPRQPPAPPRQAAAVPRQPPAPPRQKLHSVRGRGRRVHYTDMPVYRYFTASNGQGHQEEDN